MATLLRPDGCLSGCTWSLLHSGGDMSNPGDINPTRAIFISTSLVDNTSLFLLWAPRSTGYKHQDGCSLRWRKLSTLGCLLESLTASLADLHHPGLLRASERHEMSEPQNNPDWGWEKAHSWSISVEDGARRRVKWNLFGFMWRWHPILLLLRQYTDTILTLFCGTTMTFKRR